MPLVAAFYRQLIRLQHALEGMWAVGLQVLKQPIEPILHPSVRRLRWLGWFIVLGQIIYGFIWIVWLPQAYDGWPIRAFLAALGLLLVIVSFSRPVGSRFVGWIFVAVCWIELPLFFNAMYLLNNGNAVWLASCVAMIIIYYALTDWRIATAGMVVALIPLLLLYFWASPQMGASLVPHLVTYCFSWFAGLLLGISSVNLRTEHLKQTLSTMGILAHELRTPIATVGLMGEVLSDSAQEVRASGAAASADRLQFLSTRLAALVRMMHYNIDTQIANARQSLPQTPLEPLQASVCLESMLTDYPFATAQQRQCVQLELQADFAFLGVPVWMTQILNNLMKNALYALAAKQLPLNKGSLRLLVTRDAAGLLGKICVIDQGIGITKSAQKNVFQPFYSSQRGSSHGLGLAYCQRTIHALGGTIHLDSEVGVGTSFILQLPLFTKSESNANEAYI